MITRSVDVVLSRDGIYLVFGRCCGVGIVEVDGGRCWLLAPDDFRRAGEVAPGEWSIANVGFCIGPFARAAAPTTSAQGKG